MDDMGDEDDLETLVESNEEESEIHFVVRSVSGRRIPQNEFILELERYLHDVTQAEVYRADNDSSIH